MGLEERSLVGEELGRYLRVGRATHVEQEACVADGLRSTWHDAEAGASVGTLPGESRRRLSPSRWSRLISKWQRSAVAATSARRALPKDYGGVVDVESRSRLASVLDVLEHEMQALDALREARLSRGDASDGDAPRGDRRNARVA